MDQLKTAIVPVTGQPQDESAVGLACGMVRPYKGMVWALYIIEVSLRLPLDADVPLESARGERVLQDMERIGKSHKCTVEGEILQARDLGPAIVGESVQRNADLVVIGTEYLENFGVPTLGHVVPYLLLHSPCKVVVYRDALPASAP